MPKHMGMRLAAGALLSSCLPLAASADGGATHDCARIAEPAARLACYDKAFPLAPDVLAQAERNERQAFGLKKETPVPANPGSAQRPPVERVESVIASISYDNDGRRTITLDNGQAWRLTEAGVRGHMAEGDRVSVRAAAMGSYMIVTQAGVALRAKRVK